VSFIRCRLLEVTADATLRIVEPSEQMERGHPPRSSPSRPDRHRPRRCPGDRPLRRSGGGTAPLFHRSTCRWRAGALTQHRRSTCVGALRERVRLAVGRGGRDRGRRVTPIDVLFGAGGIHGRRRAARKRTLCTRPSSRDKAMFLQHLNAAQSNRRISTFLDAPAPSTCCARGSSVR